MQSRHNESESRGGHLSQSRKIFCALHFLTLYLQLVILESAFVMVRTVLSVSCLLFFSRYQHSKLGADVPFELPASFTITNSPSRAKWNYSRISLVKNPR